MYGVENDLSPGQKVRRLTPPIADKKPKWIEVHGERLLDNYFWLRDKTNPEVLEYIQAENQYADKILAPTQSLQESLYDEMLGRIQESDSTVAYPHRGYFYFSRTVKGKQYPLHCRKHGSMAVSEELLLDLNSLAEGKSFLALGAMQVSADGNLLAYATDETGFQVYNLHIKDLRTGRLFVNQAQDVGSVVWAADNRTLFYTTKDATKRSYRLYRHSLDSSVDQLIYEELDPRFGIYVWLTRSGEYLVMYLSSLNTTELRFLPAKQPHGTWQTLISRELNREAEVDHQGNHFLVRTNDAGINFRLVAIPVNATGEENWKQLEAAREDVLLESVDCFANHYVLTERKNGLTRFRVKSVKTGESHYIVFPDPVYSAHLSNNVEWDTRHLRYVYESLTAPRSVYDYDMDTREASLLHRTVVLGGFDPSLYVSERVYATARDGARIPISLVYKKGLIKDGSAPLLLHGYGAYGSSYDVSFSSNRLSLLDRGWVVAIAHVRGGGELGMKWYDEGRMLRKMNTFNDFIASARIPRAKQVHIRGSPGCRRR